VKRTVIAAAILALGAAGTGVSLADPTGPGNSGDHSLFGLFTAYCHNSDNAKKHSTVFQQLDEEAQNTPKPDGSGNYSDFGEWCADNSPAPGGTHPGGGGGN
jgi:hypothetical protein